MYQRDSKTSWKVIIGFLFVTASCQQQTFVSSQEGYRSFLYNNENGLIQTKKVNGVKISAIYLPADYLSLGEVNETSNFNNTREAYADSKTFLLLFQSDLAGQDLTYYGLNDPKEYAGRQYDLNFLLGEAATIKLDNSVELSPKLSHWENTYGLSDTKALQIVFADSLLQEDQDIQLQFADPLFETGISQFVFQKEHLSQLPEVVLNN